MQSPKSKSQTPLSRVVCAPWFKTIQFIVIVLTMMQLWGCSTARSVAKGPEPDPLVKASCPELTPLTDPSFGGTVTKLAEVAGIYNECRTAALAGQKTK